MNTKKIIINHKKDYKLKKGKKDMTLIIGMFYNNNGGAIIVSDSRVSLGTNYDVQQKVEKVGDVILSSSGLSSIGKELNEEIEQLLKKANTGKEIKKIIQQAQKELWYYYKGGNKPIIDREGLLECMFSFCIDKPELFVMDERGFVDYVENFEAVGDGEKHARNILRNLYRPEITKEEAINIAIHTIIEASKLDMVVDNIPQIAVIEKDKCEILNYDNFGKFIFDKPEINRIKDRINGIALKQTKVFNILLNGNEELKKELNNLLEKYDNPKDNTS